MGPYINRCLTGPGVAGECKVVNFPVSGFVFGEFSVGADLRNGQAGRFIVRRARFAVGPERGGNRPVRQLETRQFWFQSRNSGRAEGLKNRFLGKCQEKSIYLQLLITD